MDRAAFLRDADAIIGARIRKARLDKGMTGDEVVASGVISKAFLSEVENGKRGITAKKLIALADVLGKSPSWFFRAVSPYGRCPHCDGIIVQRERRPGGNDTCGKGHVFPSSAAVKDLD